MADTDTSAQSESTTLSVLKSKEVFIQTLAGMIVAAWLAAIFLKLSIDQTLTNVVMIVVGYFFGSSRGSQAKDETNRMLAQAATGTGNGEAKPPAPEAK